MLVPQSVAAASVAPADATVMMGPPKALAAVFKIWPSPKFSPKLVPFDSPSLLNSLSDTCADTSEWMSPPIFW